MNLLESLNRALSASGDYAIALALLFAAVFLTVLGIASLVFTKDTIARRLGYSASKSSPAIKQNVVIRGKSTEREPSKEEKKSHIRDQLAYAGYRGPGAVRTFYLLRIAFALVLPMGVSVLLPALFQSIAFAKVMLFTPVLSAVGFLAPSIFLDRRIRARRQAVYEGFPDALDMLLVCVEAGLGLDAALNRMAIEIGHAHPVIAEEFLLVAAELRAGKNRMDVLRDLAKRVAVDEVTAFVTVLGHSERFGTSIAEALRVYAAEMRAKRLVRAEEKANQLPVKLSLAVAFCTVPAMVILILAPAIVTIARGLAQLVHRT